MNLNWRLEAHRHSSRTNPRLPKSLSSKRQVESPGKNRDSFARRTGQATPEKASLLMGDLAWPRGRGFSLAWRSRNAVPPLDRRLPGRRLLTRDLRNFE